MRRGRLAGILVSLLLAVAVAGCSETPSASEREAASEVRVGLVDYDITTPSVAVRPGSVTLRVTNAGQTAHDLRVAGQETTARLATLDPGEADTLEFEVSEGEDELTLWCTLPGHRQQGMETTLPVARTETAALTSPAGR